MKIPVAKPYLAPGEARAAYNAVLSGWVTQGPRVEEFENKFAAFVGANYAVAVSSCTSALHLAMLVAGIEKDDEVICPSLSFIATANAIRYAGARPVFCEVNRETYNINPWQAEKLINKKTKAILIVHQMGIPADIIGFKELAAKYKLELIEDAACAAGSEYHGKKIGSHSDLVCFSFHPRKVITTGDGGIITTPNKKYCQRLKLLRQHGMSVSDRIRHLAKKIIREDYLEVGFNYRMTDIQAAIGIKQLEKLDWLVKERQKIARRYNQAFAVNKNIILPLIKTNWRWNYQSYPIYLKHSARISRDALMQKLLDLGITTRRGVMTIHRTSAYRDYCHDLHLPISEDLSDSSLLLPLFVPMPEEQVHYVIKNVNQLIV